jgi:hypothetical protein
MWYKHWVIPNAEEQSRQSTLKQKGELSSGKPVTTHNRDLSSFLCGEL